MAHGPQEPLPRPMLIFDLRLPQACHNAVAIVEAISRKAHRILFSQHLAESYETRVVGWIHPDPARLAWSMDREAFGPLLCAHPASWRRWATPSGTRGIRGTSRAWRTTLNTLPTLTAYGCAGGTGWARGSRGALNPWLAAFGSQVAHVEKQARGHGLALLSSDMPERLANRVDRHAHIRRDLLECGVQELLLRDQFLCGLDLLE